MCKVKIFWDKPRLPYTQPPPFTMLFSFLFSAALAAAATASNVVELNPKNFDEVIGQGKPALVEL